VSLGSEEGAMKLHEESWTLLGRERDGMERFSRRKPLPKQGKI